MAARQSTPASEHSHSGDGVRKRVCKACDRCRLKKSKVGLNLNGLIIILLIAISVMDQARVHAVAPIMRSVYLESARRPTIKSTLRGMYTPTYPMHWTII